jgi:hypothetical protein
MPPASYTPKRRSSSVCPLTPVPAATGPTVPRDAPRASNASNVISPSPSVQTIPAAVGRVPGSNVKRMPVDPAPEKNECPAVPEPSIAPSSASTESVRPPGPIAEPVEAVTPGVFSALSSKSSNWKPPPGRNGLSAWLR